MEAKLKKRNTAIQGLRGLGALTVFFWHTDGILSKILPISPTILFRGDFANPMFFLLAGFFSGLFYKESADPGQQLLKKIKRIYPLYFLTLVVELCFLLFSQLTGAGFDLLQLLKLIPHLFLLQSWIPNYSYELALNGPAWFLSVMLFLWLLSAPAAAFFKKQVHNGYGKRCFASVLFIFVIGTWLIDAFRLIPLIPEIFRPYNWGPYATGILLGLWIQENDLSLAQKHISRIDPAIILAFVIALALRQLTVRTVSYTVFLVLASVLTVRLYLNPDGILYRLFSGKALVFLGNRSMEFYLLHVPTLEFFLKLAQIASKGSLSKIGGILVVLVTFLAALIESAIWDKLMQRKKMRSASVQD